MGRRDDKETSGTNTERFEPAAFIASLGGALSDAQLREIASLDYGDDLQRHHSALRRIARGDLKPLEPLRWWPKEVLQLFRWTPLPSVTGDQRERHAARLFASVTLLYAAAHRKNARYTISINEDLIGATDSVVVALPERRPDLLLFMDWFEATLGERKPEEHAFVPLARFLIRAADPEAPIVELASDLEAAEHLATLERQHPRALVSPPRRRYGWVLDLTSYVSLHRLWRARLDDALFHAQSHPERAEIAERLKALASRQD